VVYPRKELIIRRARRAGRASTFDGGTIALTTDSVVVAVRAEDHDPLSRKSTRGYGRSIYSTYGLLD
jgi:hypothetical protein